MYVHLWMDLLTFFSLVPAADYMASPVMPMFCTPGVKIPSRADSAVSARSPERDKLPLPSHAATPPPPDFEARWLKGGVLVLYSSYMYFHTHTAVSSSSNVTLLSFSYTRFSGPCK